MEDEKVKTKKMSNKKFIELVYRAMIYDEFDIYEAVLAIKDHYNIDDEDFIEIFKQEKTLKQDLMAHCQEMGLVKKPEDSNDIDSLF
jgi:hypothetical protein